jgi:hypothetical protein
MMPSPGRGRLASEHEGSARGVLARPGGTAWLPAAWEAVDVCIQVGIGIPQRAAARMAHSANRRLVVLDPGSDSLRELALYGHHRCTSLMALMHFRTAVAPPIVAIAGATVSMTLRQVWRSVLLRPFLSKSSHSSSPPD